MSTVQEIEKAITQLPKDGLAVLREWFEEFDAKMWDRQFEEDAQSGKLEKLANEAIADFRAGRCVSHTEREKNIRIISARTATAQERRRHETESRKSQ
ncbi:MAG: BrnT family toxin [bacterium]